MYNAKIAAETKFTVTQHVVKINIYVDWKTKNKEKMVRRCVSTNNTFNVHLCQMMISANIFLGKLKNTCFLNFLSEYTGQNIPEESTIRENYLSVCYTNTINSIRAYVGNKKLWVCIEGLKNL